MQKMTDDDLGVSIEQRILALTSGRDLAPMTRLAFHGAVGVGDALHILDLLPMDTREENPDDISSSAASSPNKAPLEYFAFQARDRLSDWEYLAGVKFRQDFDAAHASSGVVNMSRMELFATDLAEAHRAAGYTGKGASRATSAVDISASRIDAMNRRGALFRQDIVSFWLAEQIIGHEFWPKQLAAYLQADVRYIGPRFREALAKLAGYYRTNVKSTSRAKMQAWRAPTGAA